MTGGLLVLFISEASSPASVTVGHEESTRRNLARRELMKRESDRQRFNHCRARGISQQSKLETWLLCTNRPPSVSKIEQSPKAAKDETRERGWSQLLFHAQARGLKGMLFFASKSMRLSELSWPGWSQREFEVFGVELAMPGTGSKLSTTRFSTNHVFRHNLGA